MMNFKKLLLITSYWLLITLLITPTSFAQTINIWEGTSGGGCNTSRTGCTLCDGIKVAQNIVQLLFELAVPIAVAVIVWGSFLILTAGGSEERFSKGKQTITAAVIGLVIALAAWSIVNVILHLLTGNVDFPWNNVQCVS